METIKAGGGIWILQRAVSDGDRQRFLSHGNNEFNSYNLLVGGVYFVGSSP